MAQAGEIFSDPLFASLMLYLPAFGLLILIVVLLALLAQRERMIVSGTLVAIAVFLMAAAGFEYSSMPRFKEVIQPPPPAPVVAAPVVEPEPEPEPEEPMEEAPEPVAPPHRLVAVDRSILETKREEDKGRGLSIISEPARPAPAPRLTPVVQPAPTVVTPTPEPEPVAVPQPRPQPRPAPVVTPKPEPKPAPRTAPPTTSPSTNLRVAVSSPTATTGNLRIEIRGPLLEISKTHVPKAHLMIILDGRIQQVIPPTRYREDFLEDEMGGKGELNSVTYFWENVVVNFENLNAGPHSVMIDTALMDTNSHRAEMTSSQGSLKNDWNGFKDVRAGQTAQLVFGGKNWMTQQLDRLR